MINKRSTALERSVKILQLVSHAILAAVTCYYTTIPDLNIWAIRLINQSDEIDENQLSNLSSEGAKLGP